MCVSKHAEAQDLRREGKLRASREALLICSKTTCPQVIRSECVDALARLESTLSSVVISARSESGTQSDVRVLVDGEELTTRLDGRPLTLDPGSHEFKFELAGYPPVNQTLTLREGERDRAINVLFEKPAQPAPKSAVVRPPPRPVEARPQATTAVELEPKRPVPTVVYVLGGVSVASTAVFSWFALSGLSTRNSLRSSCAPYCSDEDISPAETKFLVADIALGTAIVTGASAVVLYLLRPTQQKSQAQASSPHARSEATPPWQIRF